MSAMKSKNVAKDTAILTFAHDGPALADRKRQMDDFKSAYVRWAKLNGYHASANDDTLTITGKNVYGLLKHEQGVHTIVYAGEGKTKGRQYRVDVTVLVREPQAEQRIDVDDRDVEVLYSGSRGPGGQNVNRVSNNVMLVDAQTGITQVARGRSRTANIKRAKANLERKLEESSASDIERIEMPTEQVRRYDLFTLHQVTDQKTKERISSDDFYKGNFMELLRKRQ